jgi:hypothetical protein
LFCVKPNVEKKSPLKAKGEKKGTFLIYFYGYFFLVYCPFFVSTKEKKNPDPIAESVVKPLDNLPIGLWIVGASYSFLLIVVELFFGGREISPRLKRRKKKKIFLCPKGN